MRDWTTSVHVLWLFAVGAAFAPAARAIGTSVVTTAGTGRSTSIPAPRAIPEETVPGPVEADPFERAFRLRSTSVEVISVEAADAAELRTLAAEFRPTIAVVEDPVEHPEIPNHPALNDRFYFGAGAFAASSNTEGRLDSSVGVGTTVDFEELLGLDSGDVVPWGAARWRFTERWRLEFEYFSLDRSNTETLDSDVIWGDQTFPAGTSVTAAFDIAVMRFSCGYSFFKRQDKELGVALGFHVTDIGAELVTTGGSGDDSKLLAPLPVLSLYGQFALTDTWAVAGRVDAFQLEYDVYSGHVYSIGVDALCQPWRHLGFGLGWRSLEIEASVENDDWKGEVGTSYQGPIVFVAVSF